MPLTHLAIRNFRNLAAIDWELAPGLNILEGENAQGKTNLLEAAYYLANGRSFRASDPQSLIRSGEGRAELRGRWVEGDLTTAIEMRLDAEGRETKLQGKPLHRLGKIHEFLRVLVFTPDSSALFRGSPGSRRRYFDHAISVARPEYAAQLSRYVRILRQRNQGLESGAPDSVLEGFDRQWAEAAQGLLKNRREYLTELTPLWQRRLAELSGMELEFAAHWEESGGSADPDELLKLLERSRPEERRRQRTLRGPHLDDLRAAFLGRVVREIGSQGQQRLLVIALKLAEADLFQSRSGKGPVFLLDDLGSELDAVRQRRLISTLGELHAQTVLTTTHAGIYADLQGKTSAVQGGVLFTKIPPYVTT